VIPLVVNVFALPRTILNILPHVVYPKLNLRVPKSVLQAANGPQSISQTRMPNQPANVSIFGADQPVTNVV